MLRKNKNRTITLMESIRRKINLRINYFNTTRMLI